MYLLCTILTVSCVNLRIQIFVFNVLVSCHGRFEITKKLSLRRSWNYQNSCPRAPVIKIHVVWDFFEQTDYTFSCAIVYLVHLDDETLSRKGISFITLISRMITKQILRKLSQRNYNVGISNVIKIR